MVPIKIDYSIESEIKISWLRNENPIEITLSQKNLKKIIEDINLNHINEDKFLIRNPFMVKLNSNPYDNPNTIKDQE